MAPSAVGMIGKKKRRRGKKEEASSSVAAPDACEPKQRKRRAHRSGSPAPDTCILLSLI
jgi:hypothetical protein